MKQIGEDMLEFRNDNKELFDSTKDSFYLYSNIINLRHYTSLDAIVARNHFQTNIYTESLGTLIPFGVLVTRNIPSQDTLSQFPVDVNPVVLEFSIDDLPKQRCHSMDENYTLSPADIFPPLSNELFRLIPGYIPMCLLKRIYFRSEDELRDFKATKFRSMEFDESKFFVNSKLFNGNQVFDLHRIQESGTNLGTIYAKEVQDSIFRRDRLRGAVLASTWSMDVRPSESVSIDFDKSLLNVLAMLTNNDEYGSIKEFQTLTEKIDSTLTNKGITLPIDLELIPKDTTPYYLLGYWPLSSSLSNQPENNLEQLCDYRAYGIILSGLVDQHPSTFRPQEYLEKFLELFQDSTVHTIPTSSISDFDRLLPRYQKAVEVIKRVVSQKEKAVDVLKSYPEGFYALKAFMIFATAYTPDNFIDLDNKLGKFPLTPYERRMVWSMYGMLNGVVPLGERLKQRRDLLTATELIAQTKEINDLLPSFRVSVQEALRKNVAIVKDSLNEGPDGKYLISCVSRLGIILNIRITDPAEPIRLTVLNQLLKNELTEQLRNQILHAVNLSERYYSYITDLADKDFKVEATAKGIRLRHKKPLLENKKVWEDWDLFKKEYLEDRKVFSAQSKADLDVWKKLIRGEYTNDDKSVKTKKKRTSRKKLPPTNGPIV